MADQAQADDGGWEVIPRAELRDRLDEALSGTAHREVLIEEGGRLAFVLMTMRAWSDLRGRRRAVRIEDLTHEEMRLIREAESSGRRRRDVADDTG